MPRYYLHIRNGNGYSEDPEGQDLPDLPAARDAAIDGVRSLIAEEARQGHLDLTGSIEIADGEGNILRVVPFTEAVELRQNG